MFKFYSWQRHLMDKAKDGTEGGGSGGGSDDKNKPDPQKQYEEMKSMNAKLLERLDALEKKNGTSKDKEDDSSLADKARLEREANEKKGSYEKSLESALNFNIAGKNFVKENQSLIPKTIEGIFAQAEKEKYDSAIDKANAIKVGVVSEFFAVQANMDLLTQAQKVQLEDFLKLTKNGKQERVENVYSMIFEPTLESLRKIEKAKQLNNGSKNQTDGEKALAEKMMKLSRQHYLGEKQNA